MYTTFLFIILQVLVINIISLHSAIWQHISVNESDISTEFTIHLIQKCIIKNDPTVAMIGDVPEAIVKKLHLSETVATAFLGNVRSRTDVAYAKMINSRALHRESFWIGSQRIIHAFVIATRSQPLLRRSFGTAKTSVWWNSKAFFILTSSKFKKGDCKNAFIYLWTTWQMGILQSVFLCKDNYDNLAVYSYSPFYNGHNNEFWERIQVYGGRNGHPWTLIKLKQVHDINICESTSFDRVKKLDGHTIRVGVLLVPPTLLENNQSQSTLTRYYGEDAMIISAIWKTLNGSIQTISYAGSNPIGFEEGNVSYSGFMGDVSMGKVDHGMNGLWEDHHWKIKQAYPHAQSTVHWMTPNKGNIPKWMKFAKIHKLPVAIGYQMALFIATIFRRYVDRRTWSDAIFEVLRSTLYLPMLRQPRRLSSRIYWTTLFVMYNVMFTAFQGSLISLLTKQTSYQNIDGADDLLASGYPIYAYSAFKPFFHDSKLANQFHIADLQATSCFNKVARGQPVACVSEYLHLESKVTSVHECHISKIPYASFYTNYFTRLDWPLFDRFDTLVQRLFNAGITKQWRAFYLEKIIRRVWFTTVNAIPPPRKVLSLNDLAFVFYILIIGSLCSFVTFVAEILLVRIRTHQEQR